MKLPLVTAVTLVLLVVASTALGQVTYMAPPVVGVVPPVVTVRTPPARVVYHYWPTAPVVVQPAVPAPAATIVAYPGTVVSQSVAVPAAVAVPAPMLVPAVVYPAPAVIRAKVYYPGQPVRNVIRAVVP